MSLIMSKRACSVCPLDGGWPVCDGAVRVNYLYLYLGVLQWLRSQGCPWHEWTGAQVALEGHLKALQWLRSQGCPWDEHTMCQCS